jgi:hypothetical protein
MNLQEVIEHNRRVAAEASAKKDQCPRCDLHGGLGYSDPDCPVCRGKGWVKKEFGAGGIAESRRDSGQSGKPSRTSPLEIQRESEPVSARPARPSQRIRKATKPLLNKTETRCRDILLARGYQPVLEQAITLRLDTPFRSYRPDLAYMRGTYLTLVEIKGPHRFREKGIAKAALAAKCYPMFRFELWDWTDKGWKESVLGWPQDVLS